MEYIYIVPTTLFFGVTLASLYFGFNAIKLNPKESINKIFLFLCIALSISSFGAVFTSSSKNIESALFWRRFSAIGWSFICSINLHLLLVFTRKDKNPKKDKIFYLLYIPSFISLYVFVISKNISIGQYNLVENKYGWINISPRTIWNLLYYLYYSIYSFFSIRLLLKWKKDLSNKIKIKQVNLILKASILAFLVGGPIEILLNYFLKIPFGEISSFFILAIVLAIYNSLKYYNLTSEGESNNYEIIATDADKKRVFYNLAIGYFIAGIISVVNDYSRFIADFSFDITGSLVKSSMLIIISISIYLIQFIKKESLKENLTIVVLVTSIPMISLHYIEHYSVTVWIFPVMIIVSSLVFSKKTLLISATVVSIITQRIIWVVKSEGSVLIQADDYITRILIFMVTFAIAYSVNKIYTSKIKENEYQMKFQKMDSEISSDFITINRENFNEKISKLLAKLGDFFELDRISIYLMEHENNIIEFSHEWYNEGIDQQIVDDKKMVLESIPWWVDKIKKDKHIYVEDINVLPDAARRERKNLLNQNVKSLVCVTIEGNDNIQGFICGYCIKSFKKWTSKDIELFKIMSNLLSEGLSKLKTERKIEFMAYYDKLTKLPNRYLFTDRLTQSISLAKRSGDLVNILFIDLDNFKSVNDTIGHNGGDQLLVEIAKRLSSKIRVSDTISRFGGDEFMIMLNDMKDLKDTKNIVDSIMEVFLKSFMVNEQEFFITGSLGISTYPFDGEDAETLIKNADIAMHEAKSKGKNQYSFCTREMKAEVIKNMRISNDLYRALEREEFEVYYQPQIDLKKQKINGMEALLRWKHPEFGFISPETFIPVAEKNGLINKIGEWVLRTACSQNKKWQEMGLGYLNMAVNLSAIQFVNPYISDDIKRILKETDLKPKYLEIEITESIAINETDFVVKVLNNLKKIGISIAIDDFGTEYSSLSRLKDLPIDKIKIDIQFVQGIGKGKKDKAIAAIIINLAKSLELEVIAEGVETEEQLDFLNRKMCDIVQGYFYYKPMTARDMEKVLKEIKDLNDCGEKTIEQFKDNKFII